MNSRLGAYSNKYGMSYLKLFVSKCLSGLPVN